MQLLAPKNRLHNASHRGGGAAKAAAGMSTTEDDMQGASASGGGSAGGMSSASSGMASGSSHHYGANPLGDELKKEHHVTSTWFLRVCMLLNGLTGLAACFGIMANAEFLSKPALPADVALAFYGIFMCIVSILTECEWSRLFSWVAVLQTWVGRGLNNILAAVLIFERRNPRTIDGVSIDPEQEFKLLEFSGNFLLVVGCLYVFGGLACLGRIKERHLTKLRKRDEALVQRRELESKKQEIESLLRDTESQLERL